MSKTTSLIGFKSSTVLSTYQKDHHFPSDEVWLSDTTNTFFSLFFYSDCTFRIQTTLRFIGLVIIVTCFLLLNLTKLIFRIFNRAARTSFRLGLVNQ